MSRLTRLFARLTILCSLIAPSLRADETAACPEVQPRKPRPSLSELKLQDQSVRIRADQAQLDADGINIFSGNAELRYKDQTILADKIIYDKSKDEFEASGDVRIRDDAGDQLATPIVHLQRETGAGYTGPAVFTLGGNSARGDAKEIIFESREQTRMKGARYTSCQPGQDDWFIIARDLKLDDEEEVGTARDARIEFKGVPIFYFPYLSFPISDKRKSGFLAPRFGNSSNSGFFFTAPYYVNIAPDFDATITPWYLSKRGMQLQNEARYLGKGYDGVLKYEFIPHDRIFGSERSAATFLHNQMFNPYWSGTIDTRTISDKDYLTDFGDNLAVASQTHLPQKAEVNYGDSIWRITSRAFAYQTIDKTIPAAARPYDRVPQVLFSAEAPSKSGGPHYQFQGELVNFDRGGEVTDIPVVTGTRVDLYPSISLPWRDETSFLVPKLGIRYTGYDLPGNTEERLNRTLGILSLDSGLLFERAAGKKGDFTQTLEPRLFYLYVPYKNQDQLPNFDTNVSDFNFSTLFRENRFIGADRVGDANQATIGVTSRLLDSSGAERLRGSIGEVFYFRDQAVNLPAGTTNRKSSDIVAETYARLAANWYTRNGLQWDTDQKRTDRGSFYLQYHPAKDKIINFGYRYARHVQEQVDSSTPWPIDIQEQVDLSAQWPIGGRWSAIASRSYSLSDSQNLESYFGFQYNACCWMSRVYQHSRVGPDKTQINTLMWEFQLTGLIKMGSVPGSPLGAGAFIFNQ